MTELYDVWRLNFSLFIEVCRATFARSYRRDFGLYFINYVSFGICGRARFHTSRHWLVD